MAMITLVIIACSKKEDPVPIDNKIIGRWKCIGFGNIKTGKIKPIEPKDCEKCYAMVFKKDGNFEGHSCANLLVGQYQAYNKQFDFISVGGTEVGEMGDCRFFAEILRSINTYGIKDNKLFLYYSGNEYLIFDKH